MGVEWMEVGQGRTEERGGMWGGEGEQGSCSGGEGGVEAGGSSGKRGTADMSTGEG